MDEEFSEYFDVVKDEDSNLIKNFDKEVTSEKNSKENLETPQYFCDNCNRKFVDKNSFIRHNLKHAGDKHQCSVCEFKSGLVTDIEKHQRVEHPDVSLNCEDCKYFTFSNDNLRMHLKYEHKNIRKYKCEDCEYETNRPQNLREHKLSNHEVRERVQCSECDISLCSTKNLKKHVRIVHRKNCNLFICPNCDFETKYRNTLEKHQSTRRCRRNKERLKSWNNATWMEKVLNGNGEKKIMEDLYSQNRIKWMQTVLNGHISSSDQ